MYTYNKVFFGAKTSPFLLQVVLKQHLESFISKSEMASQLLPNLYMDDPVNSMEDTKKQGSSGGAHLKRWWLQPTKISVQ